MREVSRSLPCHSKDVPCYWLPSQRDMEPLLKLRGRALRNIILSMWGAALLSAVAISAMSGHSRDHTGAPLQSVARSGGRRSALDRWWERYASGLRGIPKPLAQVRVGTPTMEAHLFWPSQDVILVLNRSPSDAFRLMAVRISTQQRIDLTRLMRPGLGTELWLTGQVVATPGKRPRLVASVQRDGVYRLVGCDLPNNLRSRNSRHAVEAQSVAAVHVFPRAVGDMLRYRDTPFKWVNAQGHALASGRIPGCLVPWSLSPTSIRRTPSGGLWAFPAYEQENYIEIDAPPEDLAVVGVTRARTRVLYRIARRHRIPLDFHRLVHARHQFTGPIWLSGSDVLAYRRRVVATDQSRGLEVFEIWTTAGRRRPRLLAAVARTTSGVLWRARYSGGLTASGPPLGAGVSEEDLLPCSDPAGSRIAYMDCGQIVMVRCPRG